MRPWDTEKEICRCSFSYLLQVTMNAKLNRQQNMVNIKIDFTELGLQFHYMDFICWINVMYLIPLRKNEGKIYKILS